MSENWAERERRTNQLARIGADYVFTQKTVLPDQLYGLCKLTWITKSHSGDNPGYVRSTKIPALASIFQRDYADKTIDEVAIDLSTLLAIPISQLILDQTGFTNFYNPYRNGSAEWIDNNFTKLLPLFRDAHQLSNDDQGLMLIKKIAELPRIPKPNHDDQGMRPEYLITPAFFALDKRIRFPLINGNEGVKNLLSKLGVSNAPLEKQYQSMINLYGIGGITDATDLDQIGRDLPDFIEVAGKKATKTLLEKKPVAGNVELPLKDENDIESLQDARTIKSKRIHNTLTNKLKTRLVNYTLLEGCDRRAMYDVLVKNYDEAQNDLLIEVKSSVEIAHIRMAIGQVFDYWFRTKGETDRHVAILLPASPDDETKHFLELLHVGVLWFTGEKLETCSDWLDRLVAGV